VHVKAAVSFAYSVSVCIAEADCQAGNFTDCISQTNPDGESDTASNARLLSFRRGNGLAQYSGIADLWLAATAVSALSDRHTLTAY